MRALVRAALIAITLLVLAAPATALQLRGGRQARVPAAESIDDDLYIASAYVTIDGVVRGDLLAAGGRVRVRGRADGDALIAGGLVELSGRVGGSLRAAGGNVTVEGAVGEDVVVVGGDVEIAEEARVGRDVAIAAGDVRLRGRVDRNVLIGGGRAVIEGRVDGDVVARGGEVVVGSGAVIGGNLTYSSQQPASISSGARVGGRITREPFPTRPAPSRRDARSFRVAFAIFDFLWMLVLALVLVTVVPRGIAATADALQARPLASLGWGLLLLVGIPLAVTALAVILIGLPVAVVLLLAHLLALFASHAAAALAIGRLLIVRASPHAQVALGIAIVVVATNLPVGGIFLRLLTIAVGLGAVALALWGRRTIAPPTSHLPAAPSGTVPAAS